MADSTISTSSLASTTRGMRSVVFVNQNIGYCIYIGATSDIEYVKTTDGGKTWTVAADLVAGTIEAFDIWYDQWTPGDTGRNIHIFFIDGGTADEVLYSRFNTVNDAVLNSVVVVSLTSTVAGRGQFISGTKARGGNLYCAFDIDAGAEMGMYRSVDNGANWSVMPSPMEATIDQCKLFPANVADPQDIWLLYQDASTNELTLKEYDNSGNSFTESAEIGTS